MNSTNLKRVTFMATTLLVVSSVFAFGTFAFAHRGYDPVEAKAKLEAIGRALQMYREEVGVKPVTQWKRPADAGSPPTMLTLAQPGSNCSLPEGLKTFRVESLEWHLPKSVSDFANLYLPPGIVLPKGDPYDAFPELMRSRGESLPVMADYNFGSDEAHKVLLPRRFALVLRLNGKVEEVEHGSDSMDIFKR